MRKVLTYIPFFVALMCTIAVLYTFALTASLGYLALMIPCLIACGLAQDYIKE